MVQLTGSKVQPMSERIYQKISADIVNGVFESGTPLVQEKIAEEYGVSRTPVRDSLNRLVHDGLATLVPGAGYFVTELTRTNMAEVYEVRQALESLAVRKFGANYSELELARLELLIAQGAAVPEGDEAGLFAATREFHLAVVAPCPSQFLLKTLQGIWDNPLQRLITHSYELSAQKIAQVAATHRRIVAAARTGDPDQLIPMLALCHDVD